MQPQLRLFRAFMRHTACGCGQCEVPGVAQARLRTAPAAEHAPCDDSPQSLGCPPFLEHQFVGNIVQHRRLCGSSLTNSVAAAPLLLTTSDANTNNRLRDWMADMVARGDERGHWDSGIHTTHHVCSRNCGVSHRVGVWRMCATHPRSRDY